MNFEKEVSSDSESVISDDNEKFISVDNDLVISKCPIFEKLTFKRNLYLLLSYHCLFICLVQVLFYNKYLPVWILRSVPLQMKFFFSIIIISIIFYFSTTPKNVHKSQVTNTADSTGGFHITVSKKSQFILFNFYTAFESIIVSMITVQYHPKGLIALVFFVFSIFFGEFIITADLIKSFRLDKLKGLDEAVLEKKLRDSECFEVVMGIILWFLSFIFIFFLSNINAGELTIIWICAAFIWSLMNSCLFSLFKKFKSGEEIKCWSRMNYQVLNFGFKLLKLLAEIGVNF
ncbi:hypothetical protein QEN19_004068 [Hanseniaspora menglaensis]